MKAAMQEVFGRDVRLTAAPRWRTIVPHLSQEENNDSYAPGSVYRPPRVLAKRDVSFILQDFADDATLISPNGALEGLAGVQAFYTQALGGLPDIDFTVSSTVFGGDSLLVRSTGKASAGTTHATCSGLAHA